MFLLLPDFDRTQIRLNLQLSLQNRKEKSNLSWLVSNNNSQLCISSGVIGPLRIHLRLCISIDWTKRLGRVINLKPIKYLEDIMMLVHNQTAIMVCLFVYTTNHSSRVSITSLFHKFIRLYDRKEAKRQEKKKMSDNLSTKTLQQ